MTLSPISQYRTSTVVAICQQIKATGDYSACPILADALQDAGCEYDYLLTTLRTAKHKPVTLSVLISRIEAGVGDFSETDFSETAISSQVSTVLKNKAVALTGMSREQIAEELSRANGRRRTRLLSMSEIENMLVNAMQTGWSSDGGGTVSNSYGSPSTQTIAMAARATNGRLRLAIGINSANKGSSQTNRLSGLTRASKPEAFTRWADEGVSGHVQTGR